MDLFYTAEWMARQDQEHTLFPSLFTSPVVPVLTSFFKKRLIEQ